MNEKEELFATFAILPIPKGFWDPVKADGKDIPNEVKENFKNMKRKKDNE